MARRPQRRVDLAAIYPCGVKNRPTLWALVGVAVVALVTITIVLVFVINSFMRGADFGGGDDGSCNTPVRQSTCTDVKPEAIGALMHMTLPTGTVVESSTYQRFQDWNLSAVFVIPKPGVEQWEKSLTDYATASASDCAGLPTLSPDQVCAAVAKPTTTSPELRYARVDQADGSVKVAVEGVTY